MELFLDVRTIGKGSKGRTACGSSAYRACDQVIDNDGRKHNYKYKKGHVAGGVILPEGAPEELRDRQTLWQRHDQKEIRKDAQIFREVEVALHNSLSYETSEKIIKSIGEKLAEMGMCVQWDIHDSIKKGKRNLHSHLMLTMRDVLEDGTFGKKNRSWNMFNGGMNLADELRPFAAALMNEELKKIGIDETVEYKSYADRGVDKIPTVHEGPEARAMADKGKLTYRVLLNRKIKEINEAHLEYAERLMKYREARAEITALTLQNAEDSIGGLDDVIGGASTLRELSTSPNALKEPLKTAKEEMYQAIKEINMQNAGLKKEAEKINKIRQALFIVRNLDGDPNLEEEQKAQLEWAKGYLKWAKIEDLSPEGITAAIERYRELNTNCRVEQSKLRKAREEVYKNVDVARGLEREIKQQEWKEKNRKGFLPKIR